MKEVDVTKKIMELLQKSLNGSGYEEKGNKIRFEFALREKYFCETEIDCEYILPNNYQLFHKSDIVIRHESDQYSINPSSPFVSIEVKHESAVTDQFKCREYDMLHLKSTYPHCYGIMIYVKGNSGIKPERAEKISYSYDYFLSTTLERLNEGILQLTDKLKSVLSR